jgi:hypothetical protein
MKRRDFITKTSAGLLAVMTFPGCYSIRNEKNRSRSFKFRDYRKESSFGNVKIVTPEDGYYIHTFFDVCPFSPSQRYLAVTKFPYQYQDVEYGDIAEVCVIDLENESIRTVYSTKGWAFQLGANLNWGKTDKHLYTNDIIGHEAVCVRIDLETMETTAFSGPMYHISPDETAVIGFPLDLINGYLGGEATQMGYGVPKYKEIKEIEGAPDDEGLWQTCLNTNQKKLLLSLREAYVTTNDPFGQGGNHYFFHSKYNNNGKKIFQVFRCVFPGSRRYHPTLLTFDSDGTNIKKAITREQWSHGGHHPNWHPDGERIVMNLTPVWLGDSEMRFCIFQYTGDDFKVLSKKFRGSGHPSVDSTTSYLISDFYVGEYKKLGHTECPIRLIDLNTEEEVHICKVFTDLEISTSTFRVDPHPVWSPDYRKVCFNGAPDGIRQVFIADLTDVV